MKNELHHILFKNDYSKYGLKIAFELSLNTLYFDSSEFYYIAGSINNANDWTEFKHPVTKNGVRVTAIREDELTAYFVEFSDKSIFYVYQGISGSGEWFQDFKMVTATDPDYQEVFEHMNEDWIETKIPRGDHHRDDPR